MKKKANNIVGKAKRTLISLVVLLLAAGWLLTAYSLTVDVNLQEQTALVASAGILLEDKLYVRAAAKYQEALAQYQTKNNAAIEERLLAVYRDGEMWDEYYSMLRERISEQKAAAGEYIILARYYLEAGNTGSAVSCLEQGRGLYPEEEELIALGESVRYEYSESATAYSTLAAASDAAYFPAFDGEKWGYILENGRTAIAFAYEEATAFSGNYAVVKLDGVYTLIDKNGYWNAVDKNGLDQVTSLCGTRLVGIKDGQYSVYTNTFYKISEDYEDICLNENGLCFVKSNGKWALLDSEFGPITDFIYTDVARNSCGEAFYGNYAVAADENGYYLIKPDGTPWFAERFSDAKGIESGLVAVADSSGKWGFCDGTGAMVVDFQYEDAHSFSARLGAVKYAGKWGYINQYNTMVIGNEFESAAPFVKNIAIAADKQGYCRFLKLKYYDAYMGQ